MNNIIIGLFAFIILYFLGWFIYQWRIKVIAHREYLASLKMGDTIVYVDDDLAFIEAKFFSIKDNYAYILDDEGKKVRINTYQIATNGTGYTSTSTDKLQ